VISNWGVFVFHTYSVRATLRRRAGYTLGFATRISSLNILCCICLHFVAVHFCFSFIGGLSVMVL